VNNASWVLFLCIRGFGEDYRSAPALGRQFGEDEMEHTKSAPSDEPVVDCLVWAIFGRRTQLRMTKMTPHLTRQSSTRDIPCDSRKQGAVWGIRGSGNQRN
jgi:hypothetical protein